MNLAPGKASFNRSINMMKMVPIRQVANIRTGYTFRELTSGKETSEVLGLHIRDIRDSKVVEPKRLSNIIWQGRSELPALQPGEVVFAAKGNNNRAALFLDQEHKVIPSNQFLVLSVRTTEYLSPGFLCWVLNYTPTQQRMAEFQSGTSMFSISKQALGALSIPLPSLEDQKKILHLDDLLERERLLTEALMDNRETQVQGVVQQLLSGAVE